jgi:hypothetical protein
MWMWEGYSTHAWARTALLAALLAEPHRDRAKRKRPFTADDFNPHRRQHRPAQGVVKPTPRLLARLFVKDFKEPDN